MPKASSSSLSNVQTGQRNKLTLSYSVNIMVGNKNIIVNGDSTRNVTFIDKEVGIFFKVELIMKD